MTRSGIEPQPPAHRAEARTTVLHRGGLILSDVYYYVILHDVHRMYDVACYMCWERSLVCDVGWGGSGVMWGGV